MAQTTPTLRFGQAAALLALILLTPIGASAASVSANVRPVSTLPQWNDFSQRQEQSLQDLRRCETGTQRCSSKALYQWAMLIRSLKDQTPLRQLITVNRWFNRIPYKYDEMAYQRLDYWADTPQLIADKGDCEDYALAKYYTLRELGFQANDMKIMIVDDKDAKVNHALLMVTYNKARYLLDNNTDSMDPDTLTYRYTPLYSFNEKTAWKD